MWRADSVGYANMSPQCRTMVIIVLVVFTNVCMYGVEVDARKLDQVTSHDTQQKNTTLYNSTFDGAVQEAVIIFAYQSDLMLI